MNALRKVSLKNRDIKCSFFFHSLLIGGVFKRHGIVFYAFKFNEHCLKHVWDFEVVDALKYCSVCVQKCVNMDIDYHKQIIILCKEHGMCPLCNPRVYNYYCCMCRLL